MHIAAAIIFYLGLLGFGATFIGRERKTFWQSYAAGLLITLPLLCIVVLGVYAVSGLLLCIVELGVYAVSGLLP